VLCGQPEQKYGVRATSGSSASVRSPARAACRQLQSGTRMRHLRRSRQEDLSWPVAAPGPAEGQAPGAASAKVGSRQRCMGAVVGFSVGYTGIRASRFVIICSGAGDRRIHLAPSSLVSLR
jgi:hypothetical protein